MVEKRGFYLDLLKFDYRPSAKTFFDSNQKIDKEAVKAGDFMFWKSKP